MTNWMNALNEQFGIDNALVFETDENGETVALINNCHASAAIALQGAQLISWVPNEHKPVIWLSSGATPSAEKPMRGGVPICWPWFGAHPSHPELPAHGFARTSHWHLIHSAALADGSTAITLELSSDQIPAHLWPQPLSLQYRITVGQTLMVELITHNRGVSEITISEALHTYFSVSDIRNITVEGLDGCHYLDKVDNIQRKQQKGDVVFNSEVDRIYVDTSADCTIKDPLYARQIHIRKEGSRSTVIWNPWLEKSIQMSDMDDHDYLNMVCIESANAAHNATVIPAGETHRLMARYRIEPL
ncbi:MAG TPA: D-hexose-6-phosphate mutarotase [Chromatiales bacterium]|nr:D-hexose-6-phosphate mutarotase [Chromatiales bacterium]